MDNVISLEIERDKRLGHIQGQVRCLSCHCSWQAVAPEGVVSGLECPRCSLLHGVFICLVAPDYCYRCRCGCDLFFIVPEGGMCLRCGVRSVPPDAPVSA